MLLTGTVAAAGLDAVLSRALGPWRRPLAIHDPGKVVTDLAVTLALGGDCLADIALLRAEPGVYGLVASDPTVSRTIDALAADAPAALKAITEGIARKLTPNGIGVLGRTRVAAKAQIRRHRRRIRGELGSSYQQSYW